MKLLLNIPIGIVLIIFFPSVWMAFVHYLFMLPSGIVLWPIIVGLVIGIILEGLLKRYCPTFSTWEHELTHAITGLPFGMIPYKIFVRKGRGGVVRQFGCTPFFLYPIAKDFMTLSPYVLPTMTAILIALRPFIVPAWQIFYDLCIGITLGYHTLSTIGELQRSWHLRRFPIADTGEMVQSDIGEIGIVYSTIYIITVTIAIHGLLFAMLLKGYPGITEWAWMVWKPVSLWLLPIIAPYIKMVIRSNK